MTKNEWKVGDKAKARACELTLKFIGKTYAVGEIDGDEYSVYVAELKPIKTPEEIERERIVDDIMLALGLSEKCNISVVRESLSLAYDLGYIADPSKKVKPLSVDKWLIDSGYSKNGSVSNFINELIDEGYIIGADNE